MDWVIVLPQYEVTDFQDRILFYTTIFISVIKRGLLSNAVKFLNILLCHHTYQNYLFRWMKIWNSRPHLHVYYYILLFNQFVWLFFCHVFVAHTREYFLGFCCHEQRHNVFWRPCSEKYIFMEKYCQNVNQVLWEKTQWRSLLTALFRWWWWWTSGFLNFLHGY